ncbi:uncharacterized protein LOC110863478 isoform X2 [Folsomia candida]|uniref:uncharacterized protein LOC110863478 isoform X2 n=1 Tax=Folsomia candida TaxID=158441 RepID=UPI001605110A|nr:uncharacterized protein LOC110863478 isoform X2 [Folsomia candida]
MNMDITGDKGDSVLTSNFDENIVSQLWTRIRPRIPTNLKGAVVTGLNERLRFLRYETGQKFAPHYDGTYSREDDPLEVSLITLQIYLNDNFEGGETNFLGDDDDDDKSGKNFEVDKVRITPETGMILVFEQDLMHEGAELKNGVKYTVRTDVMYSYSKKKNIMM